MMRNKKTLLIIIAAFALGFVMSECRHERVLKEHGFFSDTPLVNIDLRETKMPAVAPRHQVISTQLIQVDKGAVESFSWTKVDQLIAGAHYDEAIHLLQSQMADVKNAAHAWLALASIYKKQSQPIAAVDAWFRYVKLETDDQKINKALDDIKNYLLQLKTTPALFKDDYSWLMAQFDELLKYNGDNGELHLILATLLLQLNDNYQAQYHALMAVNNPNVQKKAEVILAQLSGNNIPQEMEVPLIRYGNQYLVNASIENNPVRLLLDTGASLSGLSGSYTAKYPSIVKATKPIRLNTASGVYDSFLFTVSNITIEQLVFNQHILAQLPMDNSQGFDGLLGVDILGRFDFFIDQNAGVLRLKLRK